MSVRRRVTANGRPVSLVSVAVFLAAPRIGLGGRSWTQSLEDEVVFCQGVRVDPGQVNAVTIAQIDFRAPPTPRNI